MEIERAGAESVRQWLEINAPVTVCDREGVVLFMNASAREMYRKHGDLIGKNLKDCHNPQSWKMIRALIESGGSNTYSICKKGQKKMIYQTAWKQPDGAVGGLVEVSFLLPEDMPHYDRG